MGDQSRKASDRAIARVQLPTTERETLLPCPACEGVGMHTLDAEDGKYRAVKCKWCEGNGCVDKVVYMMFRRWLRIWNRNRILGGCRRSEKKTGKSSGGVRRAGS